MGQVALAPSRVLFHSIALAQKSMEFSLLGQGIRTTQSYSLQMSDNTEPGAYHCLSSKTLWGSLWYLHWARSQSSNYDLATVRLNEAVTSDRETRGHWGCSPSVGPRSCVLSFLNLQIDPGVLENTMLLFSGSKKAPGCCFLEEMPILQHYYSSCV